MTRDIAAPPAPVPPTAVVPPAAGDSSGPLQPGSTGPVAGVPSDLYGPTPTSKKPVAGGPG